jgi:hypothetical protein
MLLLTIRNRTHGLQANEAIAQAGPSTLVRPIDWSA